MRGIIKYNVMLDITLYFGYIGFMKTVSFEWDTWNINKNETKHGVSTLEAESVFYDPDLVIFEDIKHAHQEKRYILYGTSAQHQVLMLVFTHRNEKVRIISARKASRKEREVYEKNKTTP